MTSVEHARDSHPTNPRPAFAQPRLVLYVFLGGGIGVGFRLGIELLLPWSAEDGIPWAIVTTNLSGAFILGFLLTALGRRGPETSARRDIRLFAGTGILGGFTTYSSFATDTAVLLGTNPVLAVGFGMVGVLAGVVAAALGVSLAGALVREPSTQTEEDAA
jgi:CrcB protein